MVFIAKLIVRWTRFGHHYAQHQEFTSYTNGCCLWYMALWFTGRWSGVGLYVMRPGCGLVYRSLVWCGAVRYASGLRDVPQTGSITYSSTPDQRPVNQPATRKRNLQRHTRPTTCKPKHHVPQTATICITRELLMMGIMVPETCWADNKFCNKNHSVASSWPFIST